MSELLEPCFIEREVRGSTTNSSPNVLNELFWSGDCRTSCSLQQPLARPPRLPRQPNKPPRRLSVNPAVTMATVPVHAFGRLQGLCGDTLWRTVWTVAQESRARNKISVTVEQAVCAFEWKTDIWAPAGGREGDERELVPNPNESNFKQCYVIIVIYLPRGAHESSQQSHCWQLCSWNVDTVSGYWSIDWEVEKRLKIKRETMLLFQECQAGRWHQIWVLCLALGYTLFGKHSQSHSRASWCSASHQIIAPGKHLLMTPRWQFWHLNLENHLRLKILESLNHPNFTQKQQNQRLMRSYQRTKINNI